MDVELSDRLLGLSHGGDMAVRESGCQQSGQPLVILVVQSFLRLGRQAPAPIEGIGLVAAMAHRLLLHAPTTLVELGVCQLHQMERIRHVDGAGRHEGEDLPIGTRQIQRGEAHSVASRLPLLRQPHHGLSAGATGHDIEELATADIDELGGDLLTVPRTPLHHQHLVEPQRFDDIEPVGVIDQAPP